MPARLRPVLLWFAALTLATSPAAPALASNGPALPPAMVHHDSSSWSLVPTTSLRGSTPYGVSCVSATNCTAVGWVQSAPRETLVESWNGTAWSVVPSPNPGSAGNSLYGVSCVSATACVAVGFSVHAVAGGGRVSKTLVESWNGTTWSVVPSPNPDSTDNNLFGVSCVSAADCTAVGEGSGSNGITTLVESWNGTTWSVVPSPSPGSGENYLTGVSCVSATDCTAVGTYVIKSGRTLVESWDGTAWSVVPSPNPGSGTGDSLTGVSCVSATACTAVGQYFPTGHTVRLVTLVESWNGTGWSAVRTPNKVSNSNYLNGVSCVPATACNAVGFYHPPGGLYNGNDKSLAESNDVVPSSP